MGSFNRKNLVILDENEIQYADAPYTGFIILLKTVSARAQVAIEHKMLLQAIEEQTGVSIYEKNISKYGSDFMVITESVEETQKIVKFEFIRVLGYILPILPYSPGYGSIEVSLHAKIPNKKIESPPIVAHGPSEPLKLYVFGIPPLFWGQPENIPKILRNICYACGMLVNSTDRIYSFLTFAPRSAIPEMAHVGIRKANGKKRSTLNIWPFWITVEPASPEDLARLEPPSPQQNFFSYTVFPQGSDDSGAGTSTEGAAAEGDKGGQQEEDSHVDEGPESSGGSMFDIASSDGTIVPDSGSSEMFSPSEEI